MAASPSEVVISVSWLPFSQASGLITISKPDPDSIIDDFAGGARGGAREKKEVDNNKFYDILGVKKDAT